MELVSAMVTLLLVMDPLGNVPVFISHLANVDERRRPRVDLLRPKRGAMMREVNIGSPAPAADRGRRRGH